MAAPDVPQFLLLSPKTGFWLERLRDDSQLPLIEVADAQALEQTLDGLPLGAVPIVVFPPETPRAEKLVQQLLRAHSDCFAVILRYADDMRSLAQRFQNIPIRASRVDLITLEPESTLGERLSFLGARFRAQRAHRSVLEQATAKLATAQPPVVDLSAESVRKQLLESLPIGLVIVGADGYIAEANGLAWELLDRSPPMVGQRAPRLADLIPQWESLETDLEREDLISYSSGGRRRHIRLRSAPIGLAPAPGWAITLEDVTSQEEARRVLKATAGELKNEATLRARELALAEQERDSIKHFIATLTHDLRSPIAAAFVNSELLQRWSRSQSSRIQNAVQRIQDALRRQDRMISDLLDLTRYDTSGELPITRCPVRLDELVQSTSEELAQIHHRDFDLKLPLPEVTAEIDADGIRRALENLLNNAVKYGDKTRPISVRLEADTDAAIVHVRSYGPPMSAEAQRIVFEPFYRAQAPQNRGIPGWGVGLAFVRAIVEAHDGSVAVLSNETAGTIFSIHLPLRKTLQGGA